MTAATTTQVLRNKEYETIYVLRSDVDADSAEKIQSRVAEVVVREAGKLVKVEAWGRRKLAYPVGKSKKGVYVYVKYVGKGGLVQELERNLKLSDHVIKWQTVLTNEHVELETLTVDPEEVKYTRMELPPEAEETESRERALGLLDLPAQEGEGRRFRGEDRDQEFADDEAPESVPAAAAKAEGGAAAGGEEEEPS
jgi:small subunit ribosomal protein S6